MTRYASGTLSLSCHLAGVLRARPPRPGVVIVHGYPSGPPGVAGAMSAMTELADRIAGDMDFVAMSISLRGMPGSQGEFSVQGWKADIHAAIAHLRANADVSGVWLAGFGTGAALAICAGADDPNVRGVAALAAPADFDDWARDVRRFHTHARELGLVRGEPTHVLLDRWVREMRSTRAVDAAESLRPRPLLVMHGSDDEVVPDLDARVIADAHHRAELRLLDGAGHRLRHDPRAMAVLLGWLDRQRHAPAQAAS